VKDGFARACLPAGRSETDKVFGHFYKKVPKKTDIGIMQFMVVASAMVALFLHNFTPPEQSILPSVPASNLQGVLTVQVEEGGILTSVPRGSQRLPMLSLSLGASCRADVKIDALNVKRVGLGDRSDITAIYAMSGIRRLSRASSIPRRSGEVQLRLRQFTIPACEQREVDILMDLSSDAAVAGEHRIVLDRPNAIDAGNAQVIYTRVQENLTRRTAGYSQGSIEFEYKNTTINARYGQNRELSKFTLSASSQNNHAVSAIRFTNRGTAKSQHLRNLFIDTGRNVRISKILPRMSGDIAYIEFDPQLILKKNQSRVFTLRGDIIGSTYRNIRFVVEEESDIVSRVIRRRSM